jgi:hypothetical protein
MPGGGEWLPLYVHVPNILTPQKADGSWPDEFYFGHLEKVQLYRDLCQDDLYRVIIVLKPFRV